MLRVNTPIHPVLSRLDAIFFKEEISHEEKNIAEKLITFIIESQAIDEAKTLLSYQKLHAEVGVTLSHTDKPDIDINKSCHETGRTLLITATYYGHHDFVLRLLDAKADPNQINEISGTYPIISAAAKNRIPTLKLLLKRKADLHVVNKKDGSTALFFAAKEGHARIVRFLLHARTDPNGNVELKNESPLITACNNGYVGVAHLLLNAKAWRDGSPDKLFAPIFYAVANNHLEIVKLLVAAKAKVDQLDKKHAQTPLMYAVGYGYQRIVAFLLKKKANPNAVRNKDGMTPLSMAATRDNSDMIDLLLEAKANIHQMNEENGFSVFDYAMGASIETCSLLLKHNADPQKINPKNGSTPLIQAAIGGKTEIAALLLDLKCDLEAKIFLTQKTPLQVALEYKKLDMVVFLLQRGANIPHMNELLSFLEEQDQLDSGVLQCLKLLNLSTPAFPGDTATALNYIEKLESIQSICQKSTAVIQNHLTEVVNEVLPKDLANIVSSYDPRALEPTIKVQFFRPPTTHNALFQLQQQMLEQEKTLPGLFAPIIEEMKVTMK